MELDISEIVPMLMAAGVGVLSGTVGSYVTFRVVKKSIKTEAEAWLNSEKGQKAIYTIGVLLGNAIKQCVGLGGGGGGGKIKLENIIGSAIAGFIQSKIPINLNTEQQQ